MATNMHIKIDTISGESIIAGHEDQIQIDSFAFQMTQQASTSQGHGSTAGRVDVQDLMLTKRICRADTALMQHCCSGKHIPLVTLYAEKAGGDSTVEYVKFEFKQVIITSHAISGASGGDVVHVDVALNFAEYKITYSPQSADGISEGGIPQGWNIAQNKAAA